MSGAVGPPGLCRPPAGLRSHLGCSVVPVEGGLEVAEEEDVAFDL